eukprot:3101659-Amphidinium_carterae.2
MSKGRHPCSTLDHKNETRMIVLAVVAVAVASVVLVLGHLHQTHLSLCVFPYYIGIDKNPAFGKYPNWSTNFQMYRKSRHKCQKT